MSLPHCEPLFEKFLEPWYSDTDRRRRLFKGTRPDILTCPEYAGVPVSELSVLREDGVQEARARIERMLDACRSDWPGYLPVRGTLDDGWIEAFDRHYDRDRISGIIERSDPKDYSNDYLVLVCEFGAALGHVLCMRQSRLAWLYDWPYWESSLVDGRSGAVIPPFHWAVKKFSDYGVDDGFAEKIAMCLHVLEGREG